MDDNPTRREVLTLLLGGMATAIAGRGLYPKPYVSVQGDVIPWHDPVYQEIIRDVHFCDRRYGKKCVLCSSGQA